MKYLKNKDKKKRLFFLSSEIQIVYIKYCLKKKNISTKQRIFLTERLHQLGAKCSIVKIRNRCVLTGKAQSVNQRYKLSRMLFREVLSLGLVPGFKKAVW